MKLRKINENVCSGFILVAIFLLFVLILLSLLFVHVAIVRECDRLVMSERDVTSGFDWVMVGHGYYYYCYY